jgi:hypothetical protein
MDQVKEVCLKQGIFGWIKSYKLHTCSREDKAGFFFFVIALIYSAILILVCSMSYRYNAPLQLNSTSAYT